MEVVGRFLSGARGGARDLLYALLTISETQVRWWALRGCRAWGRVMRWTSRGWFPTLRLLLGLTLLLLVGPVLVNRLSDLANTLGVWSLLEISRPATHHWLSVLSLLAAFVLLLALRVFAQARRRVVVENFVDYTNDAGKAVSGLSTLLVAELGRLRGLYDHVNQQLSVSRSVGVTTQSPGGARDLGAFLTVRADDLSDVFSSAVATEGSLEVGVVKIPIGTVMAVLGRIFKGPRLIGSVHLTDAGGGPMLTAQIVGRRAERAWRVDLRDAPSPSMDRAFLEPMVSELACRMFTDLTLRGSVRWRAIRHFIEYLHLYSESRRTPRDRAHRLRQSESALLAALSEDSAFALGYYNLGVVYGELATLEQQPLEADASVLGQEATVKHTRDAGALYEARLEAALSAFKRALAIDPGGRDATYALAVHRYAKVDAVDIAELVRAGESSTGLTREQADRARRLTVELEQIVQLCDQLLELGGASSQTRDLRGLARARQAAVARARRRVGEAERLLRLAMVDHRWAVRRAWLSLCQAEYAEQASPPTSDSVLPRMRANASAALRNLAVAYRQRGEMRRAAASLTKADPLSTAVADTAPSREWRSFWRSNFEFKQALRLAPPETLAATQYERGVMHEAQGSVASAIAPYETAAKLAPEHPGYAAHLARAHAWCARDLFTGNRSGTDADIHRINAALERHREHGAKEARRALDVLAPIFRRTLEPHPRPETRRLLDETLDLLEQAYAGLAGSVAPRSQAWSALRSEADQIRRIRHLSVTLKQSSVIEAITDAGRSNWERFQIDNARVHELERRWLRASGHERQDLFEDADAAYTRLIAAQEQSDERVIPVSALYANHSKLLRRLGRQHRGQADGRDLLGRALQQAAKGALRDPLNPRVRREVGKDHFELEQYADALMVWRETEKLTPDDPYLKFKLGLCHWHLAQDHVAGDTRTAALRNAQAAFASACLLFGLENLEQRTWAALWRGRAALELGELGSAKGDLRAAANLNPSRLAAQLLLGECHRKAGDDAMSSSCFSEVFKALAGVPDPTFLDAQWGETISHAEAVAWAGWGVVVSAVDPDGTPRASIIREALNAAREIPNRRQAAYWTALCLDAEGRLTARRNLARALAAVQEADTLMASPEIILHLLELYEAQAKTLDNPDQRLDVIRQAEQAVRKLRRLDRAGEVTYTADAGEIMARLEKLQDESAANGYGRRLRGIVRRGGSPVS